MMSMLVPILETKLQAIIIGSTPPIIVIALVLTENHGIALSIAILSTIQAWAILKRVEKELNKD